MQPYCRWGGAGRPARVRCAFLPAGGVPPLSIGALGQKRDAHACYECEMRDFTMALLRIGAYVTLVLALVGAVTPIVMMMGDGGQVLWSDVLTLLVTGFVGFGLLNGLAYLLEDARAIRDSLSVLREVKDVPPVTTYVVEEPEE